MSQDETPDRYVDAEDSAVLEAAAKIMSRMGPFKQRNPDRIPEVLGELERIWRANPDMRLGQLMIVAHRRDTGELDSTPSLFNFEDTALLEKLRAWQ
jgi:hypothetical protein